MIGVLTGSVLHVVGNKVLLDVGGVGYEIAVPSSLAHTLIGKEGESAYRLYITTVLRENDLRLFGFRDLKHKQLFELLLSTSGVGPLTALAIVDRMPVEDFYQHVYSGDSASLTKVKGIGKKTAERIVLELRDKIAQLAVAWPTAEQATATAQPLGAAFEDALAALVGLGYRRQEAMKTLEQLPTGLSSTAELIRQSLASLGKWKRSERERP